MKISKLKRKLPCDGITLVEVMIVVAILGIITPVLTKFLTIVVRGISTYEAKMTIRKTNQLSLNKMSLRFNSCKRIFYNTSNDLTYLNALNFTGSPAKAANYKLPSLQFTNTLDPGTTYFTRASVGNCLFFANLETTIQNSTESVRIDVYRFNFYYLTTEDAKTVGSKTTFSLIEWRSEQFADLLQIQQISNSTKKANVVKSIYSSGIKKAWDSSYVTYSVGSNCSIAGLDASGNIITSGTPSIDRYEYTSLLKNKTIRGSQTLTGNQIITGVIIGGFQYGVSPNSVDDSGNFTWAESPKPVPVYALTNSSFPGGFETAVAGPAGGRQVVLRLVLVGQGMMRTIMGDELQLICTAKDIW